MNLGGESAVLSHFPYPTPAASSTAEDRHARYLQWQPPDAGAVLLHGHTHDTAALRDDRPGQVHVGLDAHRGLVSESAVVALIRRALSASSPTS